MENDSIQIEKICERLKSWLFQHALPIWRKNGIEQGTGGFFERLNLDGLGLLESQRARVPSRQIYSFVEAGRLGWDAWKPIVVNGYKYFCENFIDTNGAVISKFNPVNGTKNLEFDLYNQAFALFSFAQIADVVPEFRENAEQHARKLLKFLKDNYAHQIAGFNESIDGKLPLRSNPHMHLFEAFLAWELISEDGHWSQIVDEIANLCLNQFIDQESGVLREFFDSDWRPMQGDLGKVVEPGHLFEWAWLLVRWGNLRGEKSAILVAKKLFEIGIKYGIDMDRQVVVLQINDDFTVRDPVARLWPQTELIKAAILLAKNSNNDEKKLYEDYVIMGIIALEKFFDIQPKGLWRDKLNSNGEFIVEPVPASSFYHIICALSELFSNYSKPKLER